MVQYEKSLANYPEFISNLPDSSELALAKGAIDKAGAENTYYFTYDWRKDPLEVADELNALVETAKADSGKDKVHIAAASMGGMITTAYLYKYGNASVESVTYLSAAHNGTYVCGDALNGKIHFSSDALYNTVMNLIPKSNMIIDLIVDVLFVGLKFVEEIANNVECTNELKSYKQNVND